MKEWERKRESKLGMVKRTLLMRVNVAPFEKVHFSFHLKYLISDLSTTGWQLRKSADNQPTT